MSPFCAKTALRQDYRHAASLAELQSDWEAAQPAEDIFLQPAFLRLVENNPPEGITPHYLVFYREGQPVGVACLQIIDFRASRSVQLAEPTIFQRLLLSRARFRVLICGNVLLSGDHGYFFQPGISEKEQYQLLQAGMQAVLNRIPRLQGFLVKDLAGLGETDKARWAGEGYAGFCFLPNMVLELPAHWNSIKDYQEALHSKYRVRARRAARLAEGIVRRELSLEEIRAAETEIYQLYRQVADKVDFNVAFLPRDYFATLKAGLGEDFRLVGYFEEGRLVGFFTTIFDYTTLEAHFLGFDAEVNHRRQLYLNMLYDMIAQGIHFGMQRISFGRTATEIKSSVGAQPQSLQCWFRHRRRLHNRLVGPLIRFFQQEEEWVPRAPFK